MLDKSVETVSPSQLPNSSETQVSVRELVETEEQSGRGVVLTGLQKAGVSLAFWVGLAVVFLSIAILVLAFWGLPTVPTLPATTDAQGLTQLEQRIGLYERLNKIAMDRATQLFQTYVSASLLPIFTAILGYIFGSRKE